jgi:hypothetical protein
MQATVPTAYVLNDAQVTIQFTFVLTKRELEHNNEKKKNNFC